MVYIKGISAISPQHTAGEISLRETVVYSGDKYMKCIEPVYKELIDPMASRRMSRIVKMGVYTALKCMKDTQVDMPDGIIAGTGLGCIEDTEKFLSSIHNSEEKLLNPTPFIQSTHNTIAGAIALAVKCYGYNATYTQRGFSFENALNDAILQLAESPSKNILVGGFDEVTATSYALTSRLGLWKNHPVESNRLFEYKTRGSIAGEGTAFMMLNGLKDGKDNIRIRSVKTFYGGGDEYIEKRIARWIEETGITASGIGLAILGLNGDSRTDHYYYRLSDGILSNSPVTAYKHLCGEYDTSVSFAVWLACSVMSGINPALQLLNSIPVPDEVNSVLIYNHLRGKYHSLLLLEKC